MSYDFGINFRTTAGFVTDGTNETYCIGDPYPTTRGGATFGWAISTTGYTRDRNAANDRRLAGINYTDNAGQSFQLDLPASGAVSVHLALGDWGNSLFANWDLKDNTTTLTSFSGNPAGDHYVDGSNTDRSSAAWLSSEVPYSATFSSTTLKLVPRTTDLNTTAHLRVVSAAAAATPAPPPFHRTRRWFSRRV